MQERVRQLVKLWVEATNAGRGIGVEALCADCPDLLPEVRLHVERIVERAKEKKRAASLPPLSGPEAVESTTVQAGPPKPPTAQLAEEPTESLGGYRLSKLLGEGGMGRVYLAEDPMLDRQIALKVMRPEAARDPSLRERFLREARAAAALEHDHIVRIFHVGEENQTPYLVMPILRGEALDVRLKRVKKLPIAEATRIAREMADGLGEAHRRGLIHRDVKPANVWLEGERGRVKILDFGLAKSALTAEGGLTHSGVVMGTPAYMAPEQARGATVDHRADLFSLGCVLYQMIAGKRPFTGTDAISILTSLAVDDPVPPGKLEPLCPRALSDLTMKLLAKKPEDRPANAGCVVRELEKIEASPLEQTQTRPRVEPLPAEPVEDEPTEPARSRRRKKANAEGRGIWYVAGGLSAVVLVALIALPFLRSERKEKEKEPEPSVVKGKEPDTPVKDAKVSSPPKPDSEETWIERVAALPADRQLSEFADRVKKLNPKWQRLIVRQRVESGAVVEVKLWTEELRDITPVRVFKNLRSLDLSAKGWRAEGVGSGDLEDLSPVKGLPLTAFSCWGGQVFDLSPLAGMALTRLAIDFCPVTDLTPLKGMQLTSLGCGNTRATDFSVLRGMPLRELSISPDPVGDRELLRSFANLTKINNAPAGEFFRKLDDQLQPLPASAPAAERELFARLTSPEYEWSRPKSLGPMVNLGQYNENPRVSWDGLTLRWAANFGRAVNKGNDDIWEVRRKSLTSTWESPINLGEPVNSDAPEYSAAFTEDGLGIVVHRGGELLESNRPTPTEAWSKPKEIFRPGAFPVLSRNGLELVFLERRPDNRNRVSRLTRKGPKGPWGAPEALPGFKEEKWEDRPGWLSPGGLIFLFSSNRPGGRGMFDLYLSARDDGYVAWREPISLGSQVNGASSEMSPTLFDGPNGPELFFCQGLSAGESQLFVTRRVPRRK